MAYRTKTVGHRQNQIPHAKSYRTDFKFVKYNGWRKIVCCTYKFISVMKMVIIEMKV